MIADIDISSISATKKRMEKRSLLMSQVKIRKKVVGQDIHISFSHSGRQRPLTEIIQELSDYIDENATEMSDFIEDPNALVGKCIHHKFELEGTNEVMWYRGKVVDYNSQSKNHKILYEEEEEHCFFDLTWRLESTSITISWTINHNSLHLIVVLLFLLE